MKSHEKSKLCQLLELYQLDLSLSMKVSYLVQADFFNQIIPFGELLNINPEING